MEKGAKPEGGGGEEKFGRANWILLAVGLVLLVVGFVVLSMADERASNLGGRISPFLILGAYALVFVSLIFRPSS